MDNLSFKKKLGILTGIIVIIVGIGLLISGSVFSDTKYVPQSTLQQSQPQAALNLPQNVSEIEINVISNGAWHGSYQTYLKNTNQQDMGNIQYSDINKLVNGTGNKNFKINGNPSQILIQFGKDYDDGNELTVQLVVNNTIIEKQTITGSYSSIIINHYFTK